MSIATPTRQPNPGPGASIRRVGAYPCAPLLRRWLGTLVSVKDDPPRVAKWRRWWRRLRGIDRVILGSHGSAVWQSQPAKSTTCRSDREVGCKYRRMNKFCSPCRKALASHNPCAAHALRVLLHASAPCVLLLTRLRSMPCKNKVTSGKDGASGRRLSRLPRPLSTLPADPCRRHRLRSIPAAGNSRREVASSGNNSRAISHYWLTAILLVGNRHG